MSNLTINRRACLAGLLASTALPSFAAGPAQPFSFDVLQQMMREAAARPNQKIAPVSGVLGALSYDDYRNVYFKPKAERWGATDLQFTYSAFHPGWLFQEPVRLYEVTAGVATPAVFSTADFGYRNGLDARIPPEMELPGVAGLKVRHPLNSGHFDELITFLGASYFRALGEGNAYGLSARGLAVDTWLQGPEEFPRFTDFWIERPAPGGQTLTVHAAMHSESLTGAYEFRITPGAETLVEVTAHLNFRKDVAQLGLAPLTSMFYFAEQSERVFDDFRPQVHDSDALRIVRADGDVLHRPLKNPHRVANSYFNEPGMTLFGLVQRDRSYEAYQDAGARYHDRPSVMIEPLGEWGAGAVRLVEIPADLEIDDNIALFWVPDAAPKAGEARSYRYRMRWGALPVDSGGPLAFVKATRVGIGGPSGVPVSKPMWRKFVIDFEGGALGQLPPDADVAPVVSASAGEITGIVLHKIEDASTPRWRLVIDIDCAKADLVELQAHVAGQAGKLSEIWIYQWTRPS